MKVAIMQPYFFPYIGYYQLVNAVDRFVFLDDVNFINRGWINRNRILLDGKDYLFTIPLREASQNKLINEIIVAEENWRYKILKTIELGYKKAPHFDEVYELLKTVFFLPVTNIATLAKKSVQTVCDFVGIGTIIIDSANVFNNKEMRGEERIIHINKMLFATDYINPIGGLELYSRENFLNNGINLHFLRTKEVCYKQFKKSFIRNLSIIDVMMFNDKEVIYKFLNDYEIIN